ncbi:MAG: hypothetical protein ACOCXQ_01870 [Patescibacteria group bacterium]
MHPVTTVQYACSNEECRKKTQKEQELRKEQVRMRLEKKEAHLRMLREKKAEEKIADKE